jgi:hypothetical protein
VCTVPLTAHGIEKLHASVLREALQLILDVHIAEAIDQLALVLVQVHPGHLEWK